MLKKQLAFYIWISSILTSLWWLADSNITTNMKNFWFKQWFSLWLRWDATGEWIEPQTGGTGLFRRIKRSLNGISKQVTKLNCHRWFYKWSSKDSSSWRIEKVDAGLRSIGLFSWVSQSVESCTEDAVKPSIFVDAVTTCRLQMLRNLNGTESSLTKQYFYSSIREVQSYNNSFTESRCLIVRTNIITKYNSIPLVRKVNPDLTDYVWIKHWMEF
jgi:hypothetical protein